MELDYKENKVGRILASGQTEFVGIIIPNLYMHYYSEMLSQILATYETYGYKFLVFSGNARADVERKYIEELLAYNIEGMIILSPTISSRELASCHVPVVGIEREDEFISSVNTDNYMGGVQAAGLLRKSGCDILIHVNAKMPDSVPASGRVHGFEDTCRDYHVPYELILTHMGNTFDENKAKVLELIDYMEEKYPAQKKGVFMPNDTHANVLLNALMQKYGKLPDTYQIIGFDNSPISREAVIPISTVDSRSPSLQTRPWSSCLNRWQSGKEKTGTPEGTGPQVIPPVLIRRDTTI